LERSVAPQPAEATVFPDPRRRDDAPVDSSLLEGERYVEVPQVLREVVRTRDEQAAPAALRHQDGGERTAHSVARGMRRGVEGLRPRERLREERRDLREGRLDACLPRALGKALRVAQRERGEAGERLEQVEVVLFER